MRRLHMLALLGLSSCGTIIGQVPFTAPGKRRTVVFLEAGREVQFWADLAVRHDRYDSVAFQVELNQDGAVVANVLCKPQNFHVCIHRNQTMPGDWYNVNCRMACSAYVPKAGPTEISATLYAPPSVHVERANLIVRQYR